MIKKIRMSAIVFIALALLTSITTISQYINQQANDTKESEAILSKVEEKLETILINLYHSVDMLEQFIVEIYDKNESIEDLNAIFAPIVEDYDYKNVTIYPNGIVKYIYPMEGNEKAIGDNILEMEDRIYEANLAIETCEVIVSGPYAFSEGGEGFIARKAIFKNNEFWGFVGVLLDKEMLTEKLNIDDGYYSGYKCQLTATVNNLDTIIVSGHKEFHSEDAKWIEIELLNGTWAFGVDKVDSAMPYDNLVLQALLGFAISFILAVYIEKVSNRLKKVQAEICIDKLTGLYNRKILDNLHKDFTTKNLEYSVMFIDLNDFKPINDTYGHDIGDRVLVNFSQRLQDLVRDTDFVVRMGGDEFLIVIPLLKNPEFLEKFCQRLESIIIEPLIIDDISLNLTLSYGYAVSNKDGENLQQVIVKADNNMYTQKHKNKHR